MTATNVAGDGSAIPAGTFAPPRPAEARRTLARAMIAIGRAGDPLAEFKRREGDIRTAPKKGPNRN